MFRNFRVLVNISPIMSSKIGESSDIGDISRSRIFKDFLDVLRVRPTLLNILIEDEKDNFIERTRDYLNT